MQREAYRTWLEAIGNGANTVNTRIAALSRLERLLGQFGQPDADLDAAWNRDGFISLNTLFADLLRDIRGGGQRVRILAPDTTIPEKVVYFFRSHLRNYALFLQEQANGVRRSSWVELERLRNTFLERAPDFVDFTQADGVYFETERRYKNAIARSVAAILAVAIDDAATGRELYRALAPQEGPMLRWQTRDSVENGDRAAAEAFFAALGRLARSPAPTGDAVFACVEDLWRLRERGLEVLRAGEIWAIALSVAAFVRPRESAPFKITIARETAKALTGSPIFGWAAPRRAELDQWLALLERIRTTMTDVWGWKPLDLLDVQGFLWMTMNNEFAVDDIEPVDEPGVAESGNALPTALPGKPTNLIFYGPPGTGKTWVTAAEAVRLCDGEAPADRGAVMARYRELEKAGQIAFVTFHQSYAYEDFVEGLRPVNGDGGSGFRLEPRLGVFREVCRLAEQARTRSAARTPFDLGDRRVFKMSLGRAGAEDHIYDACKAGNYVALGWGGDIDWSDGKYRTLTEVAARIRQTNPDASSNSGDIVQTWRFREMNIGDLVVVSEGNSRFRAIGEVTGDYQFVADPGDTYHHRRKVRWLLELDEPLPVETIYAKPFIQHSCYLLADLQIKREALARLLGHDAKSPDRVDQFVLIIDEINRANMSKVFGELITLIEPDKRLGQPSELTVKLPYTGDRFGVPDNLHIVGTMNTADRSIALLDTALRRRFEFREIMPDPALLTEARQRSNVDLVRLLAGLNERIEYLIDREHRIGHAYFMGCESRSDVDAVLRHKVIPLLCEYFYEDWSKVAAALGETDDDGRFLKREKLASPDGFADARPGEVARWVVKTRFADDAYDSPG